MQQRSIGGLSVSKVGLGCNNFGGRLDADATQVVVHAALDQGINFFDTADMYGGSKSETYLGQALKGHRDEVVIATKFGIPYTEEDGRAFAGGASAAYVHEACDASLRRLGVDYIDLYQQHFPDPKVDVAETLGALAELVDAGKVRYIGCSNFTAEMLAAAAASTSGPTFVSVQNQLNLIERQAEVDVLGECVKQSVAFLPYFPLASGLLTGKYLSDAADTSTRIGGMPDDERAKRLNPAHLAAVGELAALGQAHGYSVAEVAIGWLLTRPALASVIAGATKPEQVAANVKGADVFLDAAALVRIDELFPLPRPS